MERSATKPLHLFFFECHFVCLIRKPLVAHIRVKKAMPIAATVKVVTAVVDGRPAELSSRLGWPWRGSRVNVLVPVSFSGRGRLALYRRCTSRGIMSDNVGPESQPPSPSYRCSSSIDYSTFRGRTVLVWGVADAGRDAAVASSCIFVTPA